MKSLLLGALALFSLVTFSQAASSDYLLELDGVKGEAKQTKHCADGACTVTFSKLKPGMYNLTVTSPDGSKFKGHVELMSYSFGASNPSSMSGGSAGSGKSTTSPVTTTQGIESPRDVATGQSSGKRQHKYVMLINEDDHTMAVQTDEAAARSRATGQHIKTAKLLMVTVDNEHGTVSCVCTHL